MAFLPSEDTFIQVIVAAPVPDIGTSTVGSTSLTPAMEGTDLTWTATVTAQSGTALPTGTVQFYVDGVAFGPPVPLSGTVNYVDVAAPALTPGSYTVRARFTP